MDVDNKAIIIFAIIFVVAIALGIVYIIIDAYKNKIEFNKFVIEKSEKIQKLLALNEKMNFHKLYSSYYIYHNVHSLQKYNKVNFHDCFIAYVEKDVKWYTDLYEAVLDNKKNYERYKKVLHNLNDAITDVTNLKYKGEKVDYIKFHNIEDKLFNKSVMHPITDNIEFIIMAKYVSPKGVNKYEKENIYNFKDFTEIFRETIDNMGHKKTKQYQIQLERSKMSNSLRYDVLKRDGFRCKLCGLSADDGAILHVDHIIPISKGGKTVKSNLRVLCDRCNLGKSDKIE